MMGKTLLRKRKNSIIVNTVKSGKTETGNEKELPGVTKIRHTNSTNQGAVNGIKALQKPIIGESFFIAHQVRIAKAKL